jgi:hypothetical protein
MDIRVWSRALCIMQKAPQAGDDILSVEAIERDLIALFSFLPHATASSAVSSAAVAALAVARRASAPADVAHWARAASHLASAARQAAERRQPEAGLVSRRCAGAASAQPAGWSGRTVAADPAHRACRSDRRARAGRAADRVGPAVVAASPAASARPAASVDRAVASAGRAVASADLAAASAGQAAADRVAAAAGCHGSG